MDTSENMSMWIEKDHGFGNAGTMYLWSQGLNRRVQQLRCVGGADAVPITRETVGEI